MITEDYVSFEIAKLLKEKEFKCDSLHYYYDKDGDLFFSALRADVGKNEFVTPTLQMAMKWLREVHKIFISIQQHMDMSYVWYIYEDGTLKGCDRESHNNSYEQACEEAIKYCLENLI